MTEVTNDQLYELMKDIQRDQKAVLGRLEVMEHSDDHWIDSLGPDELEALLKPRIEQAEAGQISKRSVGEIFQQAYREAGYDVDV